MTRRQVIHKMQLGFVFQFIKPREQAVHLIRSAPQRLREFIPRVMRRRAHVQLVSIFQPVQPHVRAQVLSERDAVALRSAQRHDLRRVQLHDLVLVQFLHYDLLRRRAVGDQHGEVVSHESEHHVHRASSSFLFVE